LAFSGQGKSTSAAHVYKSVAVRHGIGCIERESTLASQDKITLVTGAKARLGRAIVHGLAREGHAVAVHCRSNVAAAAAVAGELQAQGVRAIAVQADLADSTAIQTMVREIASRLGPMTGLVNNAALFDRDDAASATPDSFNAHMHVNTLAPLLLSQAFAAQLPAGSHGSIVNIIDQRVWKLTPAYLTYTLSKAALWTLTQTLAQSFAPRIRVNAVGPGPTLANGRQAAADFALEAASVPLAEAVSPAAIAEAVVYLMNARSVTGQMIAVDGGQHIAWHTPDAVLEMKQS
jgi:NAD(P)-dependent dehydrogenase (short-subunit alcohol dehydrogenase family)